jgi:hypothetical protein
MQSFHDPGLAVAERFAGVGLGDRAVFQCVPIFPRRIDGFLGLAPAPEKWLTSREPVYVPSAFRAQWC